MAKDVAKLMIYLVGINTVDLFNLKHSDVKGDKICYNRSKTKDNHYHSNNITYRLYPCVF